MSFSASSGPRSSENSRAGRTVSASRGDCERWVTGSKARSVSMSSPKSSMRAGSSAEAGYTSMIPPRRENAPGSLTSLTGS